jgi:hypothetical protein
VSSMGTARTGIEASNHFSRQVHTQRACPEATTGGRVEWASE